MATRNLKDLQQTLARIDGRGYKAYKDIRGSYQAASFMLHIDYVQGDPFAAPSRVGVTVPQSTARFPADTYSNRSRRVATADFIARAFNAAARRVSDRRGTGKSGLIAIDAPGQEVLERTAATITDEQVEVRFSVGLPARGRRVLGYQAIEMLCEDIPALVQKTLIFASLQRDRLYRHIETAEDANYLRAALDKRGLVSFVADDAILPRRSGVDDRPMSEGRVVPFRAPNSLRVEFDLPNRGALTGMGVPRGVTLIVGGGYHGKSTLLTAMELSVYNHIPGDGREFVATVPSAMKIRAEDGRRVEKVDISPFINNLPHGQNTRRFCSDNASGSTSQAANIIEAIEAGAKLLLVDEDTAATNFMIRDHRMQELIAKEQEPITPFIDKVRQLYADYGISTVLVMGGSGDYFDVADTVIAMSEFVPRDVTAQAQEIATKYRAERQAEGGDTFGKIAPRVPLARSLDARKGRYEAKISARGVKIILFGRHDIDLTAVEQLVDSSQLNAIGQALYYAREKYMDGSRNVAEILAAVMADIEREGLDVLDRRPMGHYARFRAQELAAALNRLRTLQVK